MDPVLAANSEAKEELEADPYSLTSPAAMESVKVKGFEFLKISTTKLAIRGLLALNERAFPVESGWFEKKMASLPYSWKSRWVILKESWMLWSEIQVQCGDPKEKRERLKFEHLSLFTVESVERVDTGKTHKKLRVTVLEGGGVIPKRREILWKCETAQERDRWVRTLKERVEHTKDVVHFLAAE